MKLNNNFSFNLKGFDKNAENIIPKDENIELSDKLLKRYVNKTCQIIEKIKEIGLPKQGEQLRLITTKAFNSIAIIKYIGYVSNKAFDNGHFTNLFWHVRIVPP